MTNTDHAIACAKARQLYLDKCRFAAHSQICNEALAELTATLARLDRLYYR